MLQRHGGATPPSRYAIHNACTQIHPLVEMYCKWELEEDCSDLHSLMCRFDSEAELETHDLGRSLLMMVRDDNMCLERLPRQPPVLAPTNLFDVFRERLAAADLAIRDLHPQVHGIHTQFELQFNFSIHTQFSATLNVFISNCHGLPCSLFLTG